MSDLHVKPDDKNRSRRGKWIVGAVVIAMLGVATISVTTNLARERKKESVTQDRLEKLDIVSPSGVNTFQVEVMKTNEERAKGLMFRQFMPADRGMLFDFGRDETITMWMRNTYISLDMVFIKADGKIHRIHERAQPLDETTISSGAEVRYVLEVNGGRAEKLGLKAGDVVKHPLIK